MLSVLQILSAERRFDTINLADFQVGDSWLPRSSEAVHSKSDGGQLRVLHHSLPYMESLIKCVEMNWMAILVRD